MGKKVKTYGKANDGKTKAQQRRIRDEITLAELIQNAAARGLVSVRGTAFAKLKAGASRASRVWEDAALIAAGVDTNDGTYDITNLAPVGVLEDPPKGANCACALGAQALTPALTNPVKYGVYAGNDLVSGEMTVYIAPAGLRGCAIGAAYEVALRPNEDGISAGL